MGRCKVESCGPPICAVGGRVRPTLGRLSSEFPRDRPTVLMVGTKLVGDIRRTGAPGQPHSGVRVSLAGSGDEYAGSAVLAWVAWHDKIWNGESIEISK